MLLGIMLGMLLGRLLGRLLRLRLRLGRLLLLAAAGEAAAGEAAAGEVPWFAETGRCWFDQEFS